MSAVDMVNHPPHYSAHPSGIECIEIVRHMAFDAGNAVKYIYRADHKNGRQDIDKARWYLVDAISNGGQTFIGQFLGIWQAVLDQVIDHETDSHRIGFFTAIQQGDLRYAREMVVAMLAVTV